MFNNRLFLTKYVMLQFLYTDCKVQEDERFLHTRRLYCAGVINDIECGLSVIKTCRGGDLA